MKKIMSVFLLAAFVLTLAPLSVFAAPADVDSISVRGRATAQLVPDTAYIRIGVVTQNSTVAAARTENARKIANIVSGLGDYNISQKDIQTSNFDLRPVYSENKDMEQRKITGYVLENILTVKIKDIKNIASVIDSAFANGANRLDGVTFTASDSEKVQKELLQKAVADASEKARLVANAGGRILGSMIKADINSQMTAYPESRAFKSNMAMGADVASQIFAGSLNLSAEVTVVYELK